jgi:hypothetical protein
MMSFLRNRIVLAAALVAVALALVPASAQAACNGGACPITGGSFRTVVGGGFVIPQLTPLAGLPNTPVFGATIAPTGQQLGFGHTVNGFVIPKAGAQVTIPSGMGAPFSIAIQPGQLTYGSAAATVLSRVNCPICPPWGQYATPKLVQVPLFQFAPTFLGVSTNIGQSFPGRAVAYPTEASPAQQTQTIGGPVLLKQNGRGGAQNLTHCPGALVPDPMTANWQGGCIGFTPSTSLGGTGVQVTPALVKYVGTVNQFGGPATQRQVRRAGTQTNPNLGGALTNEWIGRINFNRQAPNSYTVSDFLVDNPTPMSTTGSLTQIGGTPLTVKTYETQPQDLIEVAAWGADFGVVVQRLGGAAGDIVQGRIKPDGSPFNTASQVLRTSNCCQKYTDMTTGGATVPTFPTPTFTPGANDGTGLGRQATSTTWAGPMTTGQVIVQAFSAMGTVPLSTWTNTGNDQRTVGGQGMVNLVSGSMSKRTSAGFSSAGTERTMLTLQLPEPSMALGLIAGVTALVGVSRRRIR